MLRYFLLGSMEAGGVTKLVGGNWDNESQATSWLDNNPDTFADFDHVDIVSFASLDRVH